MVANLETYFERNPAKPAILADLAGPTDSVDPANFGRKSHLLRESKRPDRLEFGLVDFFVSSILMCADLLDVVGGCLVYVVVQPVGIEQLGGRAPI